MPRAFTYSMAVPQEQINPNPMDANDKLDLGTSLTDRLQHAITLAVILVSAGFR